jgi:hypothetical protein
MGDECVDRMGYGHHVCAGVVEVQLAHWLAVAGVDCKLRGLVGEEPDRLDAVWQRDRGDRVLTLSSPRLSLATPLPFGHPAFVLLQPCSHFKSDVSAPRAPIAPPIHTEVPSADLIHGACSPDPAQTRIRPNDLQLWKYRGRGRLSQEAAEQAGAVLRPPEPDPHQCGQLADVLLDQAGQRPLEVRPDSRDRIELGRA